MGRNRIHINQVSDESTVRSLKGLLHDVYIDEMQWKPWNEDNHSNIFVLEDEGGLYLEDDFSSISEWFQISVDGQQAGVFRALPYQDIELRRYLPESNINLLERTPYEYNRCALLKEFRSVPGMTSALASVSISHSKKNNCSSVIATAHENLKRTLIRFGYQPIKLFKYYNSDESAVDLLMSPNV